MSSLWLRPDDGEPIEVNRRRTVVGRDPSAHVVLDDLSVSRRHAVIERDSAGGWLVIDNESANGTWIDDQKIIKAHVADGQTLRFGALVFEVGLEKPSSRGDPSVGDRETEFIPVHLRRKGAAVPPAAAEPAAPVPQERIAPRPTPPPLPPVARQPPPPVPPVVREPAPPLPRPLPEEPGSGMSRAEAAELLAVQPTATPEQVRKQYQLIYNDFQIRITNAPTAALKRMYQKNLQDLKTACEVLAPGSAQ